MFRNICGHFIVFSEKKASVPSLPEEQFGSMFEYTTITTTIITTTITMTTITSTTKTDIYYCEY